MTTRPQKAHASWALAYYCLSQCFFEEALESVRGHYICEGGGLLKKFWSKWGWWKLQGREGGTIMMDYTLRVEMYGRGLLDGEEKGWICRCLSWQLTMRRRERAWSEV